MSKGPAKKPLVHFDKLNDPMASLTLTSPRNIGLDATRTLAIIGMMASHTSRMIQFDARPAWCAWILLLEPIIPSLFLLMVGVSLTFSLQKFRTNHPGVSAKQW